MPSIREEVAGYITSIGGVLRVGHHLKHLVFNEIPLPPIMLVCMYVCT